MVVVIRLSVSNRCIVAKALGCREKLFAHVKNITNHVCETRACKISKAAKAVPEMTYTVSGGMLNLTHSLLHDFQILYNGIQIF